MNEVGRELDALVAECVMGWQLEDTGHPVKFWLGRDGLLTGWCDDEWPDGDWGDAPDLFSGRGVWRPSAGIAVAWEVVEHLATLGIYLCILDQLGYAVDEEMGNVASDCLFRAEFMNAMAHERDEPRERIWYGVEEAVTAPLAICRAACRAALKI